MSAVYLDFTVVCLHFRNSSRAQSQNRDDYDHDSSSISTLDQVVKQWMVAAAKCDYTTLFKMLRDDPRLAKAKDFTSGYTALHWACKHGNLDLVKLLVCVFLFTFKKWYQLFVYILIFTSICLHFSVNISCLFTFVKLVSALCLFFAAVCLHFY